MMHMDIETLVKKAGSVAKGGRIDLSSDEDLSIAVMNLISIEEHLYFTGMKTGSRKYFHVLNEIREMRKVLLKQLVKKPEGEIWCISKHLLGAAMRLIEVGNKYIAKNMHEDGEAMFRKAWELYSVFWGLNLGLIKATEISDLKTAWIEKEYKNARNINSGLKGKLSDIVKKIIDCCRE